MTKLRVLRFLVTAACLATAAAGFAAKDDGLLRVHLLWTNDVHGHIAPEGAKFMFEVEFRRLFGKTVKEMDL